MTEVPDTLTLGDLARSPTGEVGTVVKLSAHYVTLLLADGGSTRAGGCTV